MVSMEQRRRMTALADLKAPVRLVTACEYIQHDGWILKNRHARSGGRAPTDDTVFIVKGQVVNPEGWRKRDELAERLRAAFVAHEGFDVWTHVADAAIEDLGYAEEVNVP